MNKTVRNGILGLGAIVVLAVAWYLISPLFIRETVDEAFPAVSESMEQSMEMLETEAAEVAEQVETISETMPEDEMDEPMPESAQSSEPAVLAQGNFVDADASHRGSGLATIYELEDGEKLLRLEDFEVTNGPSLRVYLVKNPNPESRGDIGDDFIDLGELKGNVGNQNYEIPADVDISEYGSIVIYCQPFHVVFSTATLNN